MGNNVKICIKCPEHGEFWQTPNNHLFGAGCPVCPQSIMEGKIRQLLIRNNIEIEQEKGFNCRYCHPYTLLITWAKSGKYIENNKNDKEINKLDLMYKNIDDYKPSGNFLYSKNTNY